MFLCQLSRLFSSAFNPIHKIQSFQLIQYNTIHLSSRINNLMEFFDDKENWGKQEVKSGRPWKISELRIKSNSDLHKLWYVLYKERNMLHTMEEAAKQANEPMPSPERIDKVEESMKNIEDVIRERNKAYWELEVGEGEHGERKRVFRRDMFGQYRWVACSEHIIPYWMNSKWRQIYGPGFGPEVVDFNRRMREQKMIKKTYQHLVEKTHVRRLLVRFPDVDLEYLQELYPDINVKKMKENVEILIQNDRWITRRRGRLTDGR